MIFFDRKGFAYVMGEDGPQMLGEARSARDADLQGSNPPRTKSQYPYSFDPFTVWGGISAKCNSSDYTDRLRSWSPQSYDEAGKEAFGDGRWFGEGLDARKVQKFLNLYYGREDLILTRVVEFCGADQFILYRLDYYDPKAQRGK